MYTRFVEQYVQRVLEYSRVVFICGPRQSGKTTLVKKNAKKDYQYLTLDDPADHQFALNDPVGFVRRLDRAVIDEVHRVPELILPIKLSVDNDPRPGRFLLTGSANLWTLPQLPDSLAGRVAFVQLFPLSQAELLGNDSTFLDSVFDGEVPTVKSPVIGDDLISLVVCGGYPDALPLSTSNREKWHTDYVNSLIQNDVRDIARIDQLGVMPDLIVTLAQHSGQVVNLSRLGSKLDMNHVTTGKYVSIVENLMLISKLKYWHRSTLKRIVKSPKIHFLDSGLLATLSHLKTEKLIRERTLFGPLLESFVFSELHKLASWNLERYRFSHYRDAGGNEVDIIIEDRVGNIVAIEVKASATVYYRDFSTLRYLADTCGDRFKMGIVLYDHDRIAPFGDQMYAVPISALWS